MSLRATNRSAFIIQLFCGHGRDVIRKTQKIWVVVEEVVVEMEGELEVKKEVVEMEVGKVEGLVVKDMVVVVKEVVLVFLVKEVVVMMEMVVVDEEV
ncbi:hypothetical protein Q7C36_000131 [Tachysurus vachellii]|uniref:Uncharacterized protein n=1 Tax=Tachysurus vachellii TaxID=175792 RepID=A0AA88P1C2_TACVA|nr:hypothetical protein Q7C36_000131 [Tachysurus vachellii]